MNLTSFPIGPLIVSTGGFVFLLGVIVATWMLVRTVHEKGLSISFLNQHLWIFILASFTAGRLANVWQFWPYFENELMEPSFLSKLLLFFKKFVLFWHEGLDVFWAALGFLIAFLVVAVKKKENLWKWLDAFVLPTILLLTFWSLGAFFSAWNYGKPVSDTFLFGVTYDIQEVRYSIPLHPVQLYAFVYFIVLFLLGLRWWERYLTKKDGIFFGTMTLFVFLGNALLEFFRGDTAVMMEIGGIDLRVSQLTSFILAILFTFFLIFHTHPDILHYERKSSEK